MLLSYYIKIISIYLLESKIIRIQPVNDLSLFTDKKLSFLMPGSELNPNSKNHAVFFLIHITGVVRFCN